MKVSMIIAFFSAVAVIASPAAVSLTRATKEVTDDNGVVSVQSCIECPCSGFTDVCQCVANGCCC